MSKKLQTAAIDLHNKVTSEELYQILNIQLDAIDKNPDIVSTLPPLLIHGKPGLGKSSIVSQVCKDRGIEFIDVRLAQLEPCDIKGLPVPNKEDKTMDWFVNGSWPRDPNGKGIIFLDEITAADRSIQVASYELVLDRRLGKLYTVPPGYYIVAAGNNTNDQAVAVTMSSALANRFMHVELAEDSEGWLTWGRYNDIHPSVLGFIQYKPQMLIDMDDQNLERGWPSPRSWERVSQMCHICKDEHLLRKLVYGLIGNRAGVEFMAFYKLNAEFDNILDIMLDPNAEITIPKETDRTYAMCAAMTYLLWNGKDEAETDKRISGFYRISEKLTSDFASMTMMAAMQGKEKDKKKYYISKLYNHPGWKNWAKIHKNALTKHMSV